VIRKVTLYTHTLILLLTPLATAAQESSQLPPVMMAEMSERVLPNRYRCKVPQMERERLVQQAEPFVPSGWRVTSRVVLSDQPTNGVMLELDRVLTDTLKLRVGAGIMGSRQSGRLRDYNYVESVDLHHLGAYVDWQGLPYNLSLVGGVALHDATTELTLRPISGLTYNLNNRLYSSAEVGTLRGSMSYSPVAPYLGVAWGMPFGKGSRWRFSADLGAIFNMQPDLSLRSDSTVPGINADVAVEANSLEGEFSDHFIIATIGISYTL